MTAPASLVASSWGWRHSGRRNWAVRGLDLRVEPGEKVLLLGASGAGKSTFLQAAAGILGGSEEGEEAGELLLDGAPAAGQRGRSGLLLQDPDAQVVLARVGDDVAFGCENLGVPRDEIWRRVVEALDAVGLDLPLDAATSALSGGQKQRLALAGILAMRPGLVLLDEPTANLDPDGVAEVAAAVGRMLERTGATLIVIEHRVQTWLDLVDRVVVLEPGGGVRADGSPAEVLGARGDELAASGVWVPGHLPAPPVRRAHTGAALLTSGDLAVGRGATVAEGLRFEVCEGRVLVVTGPNGAGKSTFALTIGGLLAPRGGAVVASETLARGAGNDPRRWKSRELVSRIGNVFQDPEHQLLAPTVAEELAVGPRAAGRDATEAARVAGDLLTRLRLDHLAGANPFTLSGGEKRRLSVATALATAPPVLVLDEPTFGQDSRTWTELVALLAELLDEGTAVVAVTHDAQFVDALADDRLVLGAAVTPGVRGRSE